MNTNYYTLNAVRQRLRKYGVSVKAILPCVISKSDEYQFPVWLGINKNGDRYWIDMETAAILDVYPDKVVLCLEGNILAFPNGVLRKVNEVNGNAKLLKCKEQNLKPNFYIKY